MKALQIKPVGRKPVYDISVADVEHYVLENGVVTHNTGQAYSSNWQFIIGRRQEKEGTELTGYTFVINIEKSRYVREKSKLPFTATFSDGIDPYSGLLDIALELDFVIKPSNGWFQTKAITEDGEDVISEKKFRRADTSSSEFWGPLLKSEAFRQAIRDKYQIAKSKPVDQSDAFSDVSEMI